MHVHVRVYDEVLLLHALALKFLANGKRNEFSAKQGSAGWGGQQGNPSGGTIMATDDKVCEEWLRNFLEHPITPGTIRSAR